MYADVLGDIGMMSYSMLVSMPLTIVVLIVAPKLAKKFGLEGLIRYCLLIGAVMYAALFAVMMVTTIHPLIYMLWSGLSMGIAGMSIQMQWGLVGEAIDYNELITGKRTEGSIYGTFNLCRRIGQTIGNSAAILALSWIGYDATASVQTAGALNGIKALCILVPAIFIIGSWFAFKFVWNITPEIRAQIAANKAAKAAGNAQQ